MPLIAFEGVDGSGKSIQIRLLSEFLHINGIEHIVVHEPGGTKLGEILRTVLLETRVSISTESEILIFLASRAQLVNDVIRPALSQKKLVICDRFIDSTVAYQGYGRMIDHKKVFDLCLYATGGIIPDLTVFLDLHPKIAFDRELIVDANLIKDSQQRAADNIEQSGMDFYQRVYDGYLDWFKVAPYKSVSIDANNKIMQIHNDIIQSVWIDNGALIKGE